MITYSCSKLVRHEPPLLPSFFSHISTVEFNMQCWFEAGSYLVRLEQQKNLGLFMQVWADMFIYHQTILLWPNGFTFMLSDSRNWNFHSVYWLRHTISKEWIPWSVHLPLEEQLCLATVFFKITNIAQALILAEYFRYHSLTLLVCTSDLQKLGEY